jgi:alpha/beta hydrolase family protein
MARFVFVHGAFMGAWCWDEVAALLRAGVTVPTCLTCRARGRTRRRLNG